MDFAIHREGRITASSASSLRKSADRASEPNGDGKGGGKGPGLHAESLRPAAWGEGAGGTVRLHAGALHDYGGWRRTVTRRLEQGVSVYGC